MKKLLFLFLFLPLIIFSQCIPEDGCVNGNGIYTWDESTQYNGEWLDSLQHGSGIYSCKDYTYDGEWFEGKWHGFGVYASSDGCKYVGNWLDGKRHGSGVYSCKDYTYDGEWRDGKAHGSGIYSCKDHTYDGEWRDGKANGQGTKTWSNGDKYEGEWKDDKRNGNGILTFISGNIRKGKWKENNLFEGFAIVHSNKEDKAGLEIKYIYNNGNVVDTLNNSLNYFNKDDIVGDHISDTIFLINRKTKYDIILTINNVPVKWRFDTGAETTSISKDQWEKIKSKISFEDLNISRTTQGVGGLSTGSLVKIKDEIRIGDYYVKNFIVSIANNNHSLLGIDFLQKFSNVKWNMNEYSLIVFK